MSNQKTHFMASSVLPTAAEIGASTPIRSINDGSVVIEERSTGSYGFVEEGSYFKALLPLGTSAIAFTTATRSSFSAANPMIAITSIAGPHGTASGKSVHLDYIRINFTTVGSGITDIQFATILNPSLAWTGGTNVIPVSQKAGTQIKSICMVSVGALTLASSYAGSSCIARGFLKNAAPTIGDSFVISFGSSYGGLGGVGGGINIGPHIIGINTTGYTGFQFFLWCSGMSAAPTGDFEIGWWER